MKNDEAIKTEVYRLVKGSQLFQEVTGKLSKRNRPKNSDKEDIVISILANECGQVQMAVVNVNIYVKDDFIDNQYEEDTLRIDTLSNLASLLFEEYYCSDFALALESQRVLSVSGANEHVINNKIEYKSLNE